MAKNNSQKKRSRRQQQQQGGEGGPTNALTVFGNMNEQKAAPGGGNLIQMNGQSQSQAPNMNGGQSDGGFLKGLFSNSQAPTASSEIPAPSVPTGSNTSNTSTGSTGSTTSTAHYGVGQSKSGGRNPSKQQLQKNILKQLKQLKQQGGKMGFAEYQLKSGGFGAPAALQQLQSQSPPTTGGEGQGPDLLKGFMKAGGKLSKQELHSLNQQLNQLQQQQQQGGVGLNEIVVPLILLYASQRYALGKTMKKNTPSVRKSRRFTK